MGQLEIAWQHWQQMILEQSHGSAARSVSTGSDHPIDDESDRTQSETVAGGIYQHQEQDESNRVPVRNCIGEQSSEA